MSRPRNESKKEHSASKADHQLAMIAAEQASKRGWFLVASQVLLAINPTDSSEVWTFYHRENEWRRKGEKPIKDLRWLNIRPLQSKIPQPPTKP